MQIDWLKDSNGNKCSIQHFGSREAAQKALDSLKNCRNCTNCSDCSDCLGCSRCSRCLDCLDCSGCLGCSRCSRCLDCLDCSDCSGCSDCSDCSDCSYEANKIGFAVFKAKSSVPSIPKIQNIHSKVLAAVSLDSNSLKMDSWHTCDTTHCRAGWVVTLAGEAGKALEKFHNTELAAHLIYKASSPHKVSRARFYDSNTDAMDDIKRMAELEAKSE